MGRRYAHVVLRKADIDLTKRAGELTEDEVSRDPRKPPEPSGGVNGGHRHPPMGAPRPPQVERVITIMQNPRQYKIPDWFLNRQKDVKDGKYSQVWGWGEGCGVKDGKNSQVWGWGCGAGCGAGEGGVGQDVG